MRPGPEHAVQTQVGKVNQDARKAATAKLLQDPQVLGRALSTLPESTRQHLLRQAGVAGQAGGRSGRGCRGDAVMCGSRALGLSDDEAALARLDADIAEAKAWDRREAQRKAEEERQRREREARSGGLTLEDLEQRRAEVAARVLEQQTHARVQAEREVMERRAERLRGDIAGWRRQIATAEAELAVVMRQI